MLTEFGLPGTNSLVSDKDTQGIIMKYQILQKGGGGRLMGTPRPLSLIKTSKPFSQRIKIPSTSTGAL